jgi:hypothetical protein
MAKAAERLYGTGPTTAEAKALALDHRTGAEAVLNNLTEEFFSAQAQ